MEEKTNYKERIILFFDILGFKDIVEGKERKSPNEIKNILTLIHSLVNKNQKEQPGYRATHFSDSVILSFDILNDNNIMEILSVISSLQIALVLNHATLIRGGMCIGKIYHTDQFVFGPGVNMAYKMESEEAKYPRIIVTQDIVDMFNDWNNNADPKKGEQKLENCFGTDFDGKRYLKYLDHSDCAGYKEDLKKSFKDKLNKIIPINTTKMPIQSTTVRDKQLYVLEKLT